jgi:hypothetical protein
MSPVRSELTGSVLLTTTGMDGHRESTELLKVESNGGIDILIINAGPVHLGTFVSS